MSAAIEERDQDIDGVEMPQAKRQRLDDAENANDSTILDVTPEEPEVDVMMRNEPEADSITMTESAAAATIVDEEAEMSSTSMVETLLPPSRVLLGKLPASHAHESTTGHTLEYDVGISEYISKDLPPIHAIIKQRWVTD